MGRGNPVGVRAAYRSTLSWVCFAIVLGHGLGAWSSAKQYHPFRWRHASMNSPAARHPLTFEEVVLARRRQSAFNQALISRPSEHAAAWESIPFQRSSAHMLTIFQEGLVGNNVLEWHDDGV